ncbi:hypothetical protein ACFSCW_03435 [Sphingomonas tabacisoli]|uniref:Uncharacterized protein n=1 Tax=Sphingomonas tabacisoli TaxID=2249466 RepID=A0ABW4I1C4_9SPHN
MEAPPVVIATPAEPIPSMLSLCARGDKVAQGALAAELLEMGDKGIIRPLEAWAGVELMARLAASHGDPVDVRGLAAILCLRGDWEMDQGDKGVAENLYAEAVQIFDKLADAGDEEAAQTVLQAGRVFPVSVMEKARGASLMEL